MNLIGLYFCFICVIVCVDSAKSNKKAETPEQKLDEVLALEFKARDANHDGIVTSAEIRQYYEKHPEKMSKAGVEFIDKNFENVDADLEQYRTAIKRWLAENNSVARILNGVYGSNSTKKGTNTSSPPNSTVSKSDNE